MVVGRRDLDLDRTNVACRVCLHGLNGQNQLAVFHPRAAGVIVAGQVDSWCAVGHRAVLPGSLQRRQQRGQIDRIGIRMIVDDVQRDFFVEVGHGGLFDVEGRSPRRVGLLRREIRIG